MAQEIERKFLVVSDYKSEVYSSVRIIQGYLCRVPERVIRIRIKGEKGFITIKGATTASGLSRFEWEQEIPLEDAKSLLLLAEPGIIEKTRHLVRNTDGRHIWEIDEFHGRLEGRTLAEIELPNETQQFAIPDFIGEEVTGQPEYYNSNM